MKTVVEGPELRVDGLVEEPVAVEVDVLCGRKRSLAAEQKRRQVSFLTFAVGGSHRQLRSACLQLVGQCLAVLVLVGHLEGGAEILFDISLVGHEILQTVAQILQGETDISSESEVLKLDCGDSNSRKEQLHHAVLSRRHSVGEYSVHGFV